MNKIKCFLGGKKYDTQTSSKTNQEKSLKVQIKNKIKQMRNIKRPKNDFQNKNVINNHTLINLITNKMDTFLEYKI